VVAGVPVAETAVRLADLRDVGMRLWTWLPPGAVVWLSGEIGAGKTTLVQAVVRAAGGTGARSPTFSLVHAYPTDSGPLVHVDCYRLADPAEARDLDFAALLRTGRLILIEWPERAGRFAPAPALELRLRYGTHPDARLIEGLP